MTGACFRLVRAFAPSTWANKPALLLAAGKADTRFGPDALDALLEAWERWRSDGHLPLDPSLRDLVLELANIVGGGVTEPRLRPRRQVTS